MTTIPRNARRVADLRDRLTQCRVFKPGNQYAGEHCAPAYAWEALHRSARARLTDSGDGTYVISVHDRLWYELREPGTGQPAPPARVFILDEDQASRFYDTAPGGPRVLAGYSGPHHDTIRPGDLVVYENPAWREPVAAVAVPMIITEIIDFGGDLPPQAILNDGEWEVSADNLRTVRSVLAGNGAGR
jgi:hypothetical protein